MKSQSVWRGSRAQDLDRVVRDNNPKMRRESLLGFQFPTRVINHDQVAETHAKGKICSVNPPSPQPRAMSQDLL